MQPDRLQPGRTTKALQSASLLSKRKPVMVMEASAIGMIGAIRSLGRAGYFVHACSSRADALGLYSNFASVRALHPDYENAAFIPWLRNYVREHDIAAIVPSEDFLHGIQPQFREFAPLIPVSNDASVVYGCMSKCDTIEALCNAPLESATAKNIPQSMVITRDTPIEDYDFISSFAFPAFIKADTLYGHRTRVNKVIKAETVEEALSVIPDLLSNYTKILVQGFVPGTKVAADFCIHNGLVIVESMWEARHENPHRGGMASLRKICWYQDVHDDALAKLQHLKWDGVAMMEYRRDSNTGRFHFIELNGRFWGGLHSELYAGLDIPRIQIEEFTGTPARRSTYSSKSLKAVLCRLTVPDEIGYVLSRIRDPNLALYKKIWSALEFVLLSLDPRIKSDLNFPNDSKLYYMRWKNFLMDLIR